MRPRPAMTNLIFLALFTLLAVCTLPVQCGAHAAQAPSQCMGETCAARMAGVHHAARAFQAQHLEEVPDNTDKQCEFSLKNSTSAVCRLELQHGLQHPQTSSGPSALLDSVSAHVAPTPVPYSSHRPSAVPAAPGALAPAPACTVPPMVDAAVPVRMSDLLRVAKASPQLGLRGLVAAIRKAYRDSDLHAGSEKLPDQVFLSEDQASLVRHAKAIHAAASSQLPEHSASAVMTLKQQHPSAYTQHVRATDSTPKPDTWSLRVLAWLSAHMQLDMWAAVSGVLVLASACWLGWLGRELHSHSLPAREWTAAWVDSWFNITGRIPQLPWDAPACCPDAAGRAAVKGRKWRRGAANGQARPAHPHLGTTNTSAVTKLLLKRHGGCARIAAGHVVHGAWASMEVMVLLLVWASCAVTRRVASAAPARVRAGTDPGQDPKPEPVGASSQRRRRRRRRAGTGASDMSSTSVEDHLGVHGLHAPPARSLSPLARHVPLAPEMLEHGRLPRIASVRLDSEHSASQASSSSSSPYDSCSECERTARTDSPDLAQDLDPQDHDSPCAVPGVGAPKVCSLGLSQGSSCTSPVPPAAAHGASAAEVAADCSVELEQPPQLSVQVEDEVDDVPDSASIPNTPLSPSSAVTDDVADGTDTLLEGQPAPGRAATPEQAVPAIELPAMETEPSLHQAVEPAPQEQRVEEAREQAQAVQQQAQSDFPAVPAPLSMPPPLPAPLLQWDSRAASTDKPCHSRLSSLNITSRVDVELPPIGTAAPARLELAGMPTPTARPATERSYSGSMSCKSLTFGDRPPPGLTSDAALEGRGASLGLPALSGWPIAAELGTPQVPADAPFEQELDVLDWPIEWAAQPAPGPGHSRTPSLTGLLPALPLPDTAQPTPLPLWGAEQDLAGHAMPQPAPELGALPMHRADQQPAEFGPLFTGLPGELDGMPPPLEYPSHYMAEDDDASSRRSSRLQEWSLGL